jgi:hypothetical protein
MGFLNMVVLLQKMPHTDTTALDSHIRRMCLLDMTILLPKEQCLLPRAPSVIEEPPFATAPDL